jgi:hypothetical protein
MNADRLRNPMDGVFAGSICGYALHGHYGVDARTVNNRPSLLHSSRFAVYIIGGKHKVL